MRRSIPFSLVGPLVASVVAVLVIAGCSDGDDDVIVDVAPRDSQPLPAGDGEVEGQQLELLEVGVGDPAPAVSGPGVVRDTTDLAGLEARYDLRPFGAEVRDALDRRERVLVALEVDGGCEAPTDARLVHARPGVDVAVTVPETPEGLVCDAAVSALAVVSAPAEAVPPGTAVGGVDREGPTGPGTVWVTPVESGTEPLARRIESDADLAALPGDVTHVPARPEGTERVAFVVPACEPVTGEVVLGAEGATFTVELQQELGERVDCDAEVPHLAIADVDEVWAWDLEPTPGV